MRCACEGGVYFGLVDGVSTIRDAQRRDLRFGVVSATLSKFRRGASKFEQSESSKFSDKKP